MAWPEKLPSGKYRGIYRLKDGSRRSTPEQYTRKADAERAAGALELEARRPGWRDPKLGSITWGDWYREWARARVIELSTASSEQSMIDTWIMPRWEDWSLVDIRRHDVQVWANDVASTNLARNADGAENVKAPKYLASSSVRRILNVFVSSLSAAVDADLIGANPALRIKLQPAPPSRKVYLTHAQYAAVVAAVPDRRDKAILDFLVGTGFRWGELAGLHQDRLDLDGGMVTVAEVWDGFQIKPYPKGKKQRHVPVLQWVVDNLDIEPADSCGLTHRTGKCSSGLVFPAARGGARDDRNFTQRVWEPAIKAAGLEQLAPHIHDLRHTYASWLLQAGVPLERVSELLGHASLATSQIYAHLAPVTTDDVRGALIDPRGAIVGQTPVAGRVTRLRGVH